MNFPSHMSLLRRGVIVSAAALAVAVPIVASGAAGASGPVAKSAAKGAASTALAKQVNVFTDANGNRVEMIDPGQSHYIPKIASASDTDRAKAQQILDGVNEFCRTHTVKAIKAHWRPGGMGMHMKSGMQMKGMQGMAGMHMKGMSGMTMSHTHWFNPNRLTGIHPKHPVAALIYKGVLDGVMFNGAPVFNYLGTIPRPHVHHMQMRADPPLEMVHVYCTKSLRYAFTPNRQLGAMMPIKNLRDTIRPAVMLLKKWQLKEIRRMVRHFCGDRLAPVAPTGSGTTGPDPVLQAMRTEIRKSLMLMREGQLRTVWQKMQSYGTVPG